MREAGGDEDGEGRLVPPEGRKCELDKIAIAAIDGYRDKRSAWLVRAQPVLDIGERNDIITARFDE